MPWRETCSMEQRRKFIADWRERGWTISELCEAYGISRKTGYKWLARFMAKGLEGLNDHSRARQHQPHATTEAVEARIVELRHQRPTWGPRKLKARLERLSPGVRWPANSTIGEILTRHGLVVARKMRRRTPAFSGPLVNGLAPNDVWAMDFKGWFRTGDGTRVDPLTVTDGASRYLIRCRAVAKTNGDCVRGQLTAAFQEFGLPKAIRSDNGVPFATVGLGGLSELSVWLIRLGIRPERIRPAHPQDNGAHERMHKTLKQDTASPPKATLRAQQEAFNAFRYVYNEERPHEFLEMRTPSDVYAPSGRTLPRKLPEIEYEAAAQTRQVADNGSIKFDHKLIYLSNALIGERVRIAEEQHGLDVWYGPVLLGQLDLEKEIVRPAPTKVLPMCPV